MPTAAPQCSANTKLGTQCKFKAKGEGTTCAIHSRPPPPICTHERNGHRCQKTAVRDGTECSQHRGARQRRERWELWRNTYTRLYIIYTEGMNPFTRNQLAMVISTFVRRATGEKLANPMITDLEAIEMHPLPTIEAMMNMLPVAGGNIAPPRSDLERITRDSQNIHTAAVSEQTNRGIEILMKIQVPKDQATLAEIRAEWNKIYTNPRVSERLYTDMARWWNVKSCIIQNDLLYHKLLRRLWARIKMEENTETRRELVKRLQEECAEAFGLCCAGHINRLINVMVGFDAEFKQDVPKGTILQERFARIAQIEDEVEKFRQATEVIADLGLTQDEAAPWLDSISA